MSTVCPKCHGTGRRPGVLVETLGELQDICQQSLDAYSDTAEDGTEVIRCPYCHCPFPEGFPEDGCQNPDCPEVRVEQALARARELGVGSE